MRAAAAAITLYRESSERDQNLVLSMDLLQWRDEKNQIAALALEIEHVYETHRPKISALKRPPWNNYQFAVSEMLAEIDPLQAELDGIETKRRLRRARKWGVPIPDRPKSGEENDMWKLSAFHEHVLSEQGHLFLRRETALEREIAQKPLISWAALAISVVSLSISALNAIFGS